MFKRHIAATSIILIGIAAAAVVGILTHPDAEQALQEITTSEPVPSTPNGMRQERRGVRRDIIYGQNEALRTVLFSEEADMVFDYVNKDVSEELKRPYGFSQENVWRDVATGKVMQFVRYFQAEGGAYYHKEHRVALEDVLVARYEAAGDGLPIDIDVLVPLERATARQATIFLSPTLQMEASDVTAAVDAAQATISSHQATYDGANLTLLGDVQISTPKIIVKAQELVVKRPGNGSKSPFEQALLTGNVVIAFEDGSELTSDCVDIDLQAGMALFTSQNNGYVDWRQPDREGKASVQMVTKRLTVQFDPTQGLANDASLRLQDITAEGGAVITITSPTGDKGQRLTAFGPIHVDHLGGKATISSPRDAGGAVARYQQVAFSDGVAEMHSDSLVIDYRADDQVAPTHLLAEGSVCLKGNLSDSAPDAVAQYALCDTLEYWPAERRLMLSAKPGRVAILDRVNGIAVSAPAVEMRRDSNTGKGTIKGIGDVRFTLLDRDYQRFRERFNLDMIDK